MLLEMSPPPFSGVLRKKTFLIVTNTPLPFRFHGAGKVAILATPYTRQIPSLPFFASKLVGRGLHVCVWRLSPLPISQ